MSTPFRKLVAAIILTGIGLAGFTERARAAVLLENNGYALQATEVQYTFENASNNIWTAITTDASGNGRIATSGGNPGDKWNGGPIAPSSTKSIIVSDGAAGWNFSNMAGVPTDNYQVSIYASKNEQNWPFAHGQMTLVAYDGVRLLVDAGGNFAAEVNNTILGTFGDVGTAGLMIQKMAGEFSFWRSPAGAATWTQVGGTSTANVGSNFASLHMFIKPGGGENFWGYIDTFTVQSFAAVIPAPAALPAGLALVSLTALARRRRS